MFFLALGGVGMIAAARRLGAPSLHAIMLDCYLPAADYTLTDWLVRGAMARRALAKRAVFVRDALTGGHGSSLIAPRPPQPFGGRLVHRWRLRPEDVSS